MKNINWLVLTGQAKIEDKKIVYQPTIGKDLKGIEFNETATIGSDVDFENGRIEFTVKVNEPNARCQIVLSIENSSYVNIGINASGSLFGITKYDSESQRWEWQSGTGNIENIDLKKDYRIKIIVLGSSLTLFVNNIRIAETTQEFRKGQLKFVAASSEELVISEFSVETTKAKAFIVMQFSEEFNRLYQEVIKPICEEFGYECERADEFYTSTPIIADIVKSLLTSSIIIAEITPDNPNVYYELGYAHAINKPTILLCDRNKRSKLPFDISSFRTLFYEDTIGGKTLIEKNLRRYLEAIE